ncbi:MAG: hypothetical protein UY96_C0003G0074 [Parcubacteria group bacterium GW2011_GWB1_56_8]|nr:MAG: hypothetical protein UY96_C0003G0074 [Parcubacteria group bacterium GW2011_GWB1_56_8]
MRAVKCEMKKDCTRAVTHIGSKGYIYCAECAVIRRSGGHERCRKMLKWELALIHEGKPLPRYEPIAHPAGHDK